MSKEGGYMQRITRNALKCNLCGDIIESKYTHDFQKCKCGKCFIDGGLAYVRAGFDKPEDIEWLTEYEDAPGYHVIYRYKTSPYIEGKFDTVKSPDEIRELYSDFNLKIRDENGRTILNDFKEDEDD